jgi:hypothetical protein
MLRLSTEQSRTNALTNFKTKLPWKSLEMNVSNKKKETKNHDLLDFFERRVLLFLFCSHLSTNLMGGLEDLATRVRLKGDERRRKRGRASS